MHHVCKVNNGDDGDLDTPAIGLETNMDSHYKSGLE